MSEQRERGDCFHCANWGDPNADGWAWCASGGGESHAEQSCNNWEPEPATPQEPDPRDTLLDQMAEALEGVEKWGAKMAFDGSRGWRKKVTSALAAYRTHKEGTDA